MPAPVPIQLTPVPVPGGTNPTDINQLIALICKYISGSISESVSFFVQGSNWPLSDNGIYFNSSIGRFGTWDSGLGKYIPISDRTVGEILPTFVSGDDVANGLIVLDGRNINTILSISQSQKSNLETLFGANNSIPSYKFFGALSNLPGVGSFSDIVVNAFAPQSGTIGNLTISGAYTQSEIQALRANTETTLESAIALQTVVTQIQAVSESVLDALNGSASTGLAPIWKIFVGFP